jgi:hypothetical protein
LGLVEGLKSVLEKGVLDTIILLLGSGNLLDGLTVSKVAGCLEYLHIGRCVNFFQHHLELIKQPKCDSTFPLHNFIDLLGVKLNL